MIELPSCPEQITPAWLGEIFSSGGKSLGAESVEVIESHSGTTGRTRIHVEWSAGVDLPPELFVKLPPTDPTSREMVISTGMGRREAQFYERLGGEVPVRVPAPLWSGWSEDGSQYVMLMEDLAEHGCSFPNARDPNLVEHARALMRSLARLHAHFWDSSRFAHDLSWVEPAMRHEWGRILVKSGLEQFGEEMSDGFNRLGRFYLDHTEAFSDFLDRGPHTLIHGDCHLGNLFVDGQQVGFLDWACFSHAPGMRDVAYFICNSLPTELRRAEQEDLLEIYRRALVEAGAPDVDREEIWQQYRRFAAYSWVSAVTTAAAGSRMQSLEIGRAAMERTQAAIQDLETVALFESEAGR